MSALWIRFIIRLSDDADFAGGPSFHRWLPRGLRDAISVDTDLGKLHLWFERRGYENNGWIKFHFDRHEVDDALMDKQGKLDAGPLLGRLQIDQVAPDALEALRRDSLENPQYMEFGKKIVKTVLPHFRRVVDLLRVQYGQHWLQPLELWDSRSLSLGALCAGWNMSWSDDEGKTWRQFKPDKMHRTYKLQNPKFNEYLTESDWMDLKAAIERGDGVAVSAELVANTHRLLSEGELRYACVEAASALEVAIAEATRRRIAGSPELADSASAFLKDAPLKTRLVIAASFLTALSQETLKQALGGIKLRNDVVHDGFAPDHSQVEKIRAVLTTAAALTGSRMKFPVLSSDNFVANADDWERAGGHAPITAEGISVGEE
jgi:hypothetical protein